MLLLLLQGEAGVPVEEEATSGGVGRRTWTSFRTRLEPVEAPPPVIVEAAHATTALRMVASARAGTVLAVASRARATIALRESARAGGTIVVAEYASGFMLITESARPGTLLIEGVRPYEQTREEREEELLVLLGVV